jgi:hypothetical protein
LVDRNTDRDSIGRLLHGPAPGPGSRLYDHYHFWQDSNHLYFDFEDDETQICRGDSGSPVFAVSETQVLLIGLVSSSADWRCGRHRTNALFATNIALHLNWLNSYLD